MAKITSVIDLKKVELKEHKRELLDKLANFIVYQELISNRNKGSLNDRGLAILIQVESDESGTYIKSVDEALEIIDELRNNL